MRDLRPSLGASSALLVTSAAHLPRALAPFRKAEVPVIPAAINVRVVAQPFDALDLLPGADAQAQTTDAVQEAAGHFTYRLRGDI